ncbi:putative membrane protein [Ruegeria denitrificans]|uniref:Putative membrane protein n=1 Tax=Ruegeria denitrificans TaxID=1715692 RepID=A0A0P1I5U0_9RHOB|nr:bestrophin family ion channel [Ruegeria denitrificans]CUJ92091.1 putative membrane protein [Ruegeria denitrificans]
MILHDGISIRKLLKGSVGFIGIVLAWIFLVQVVDELTPIDLISNPSPPVAMLGLAVAFFLGFKNTSTYGRWTEARMVWGDIANTSRDWGNTISTLVQPNGSVIDADLRDELIDRHVAWLNTLAFQLRQPATTGRKRRPWMFSHKPISGREDLHQKPESWQNSQLKTDLPLLDGKANRAACLLNLQARRLSDMAQQGKIDPFWHVALMDRLSRFTTAQGQCERIKNTPFPRQVAEVGRLFSWIFIFLLPLAFNDERSIMVGTDASMMRTVLFGWMTFAPVGALVCWIFFVTERVSASMEDPFEGDVTDVPISALCRTIEIDIRQMTGCGVAPQPAQPVEKALF